MLSLTAPLKTRLQALPQLTGWVVRTGTDNADRRVLPVADVRCTGARVGDRKTGALMLSPEWTVTLARRRAGGATDLLGAALEAVIESLHSWAPGQHGGRGWERLALLDVSEAMFTDDGLAGYQLTFGTSAMYRGQH